MNTQQPQTLKYKVVKIGRKSNRRTTLEKNLTEAEAQRVVARYPDSSRSMVCYFRLTVETPSGVCRTSSPGTEETEHQTTNKRRTR